MKSKKQKIAHFDALAAERAKWRQKNRYYYDDLEGFLARLIPPARSVLEIGCGTGELLAKLRPSRGLGVDFSPRMVEQARNNFATRTHPNLEFLVRDAETLELDECFEYAVLSDVVGEFTDAWRVFRELRSVTNESSRVIVTYFNALWEPVLRLGEKVGMKTPQDYQNALELDDIANLLKLNGFEVVTRGYRQLLPTGVPFVSRFLNAYLGHLPLLSRLGLVSFIVARPERRLCVPPPEPSVSVVVPCRNERGNIEAVVQRIPAMGSRTEVLFVDGNSNDGTVEEIEAMIARYGDYKDIKLIHQLPAGSAEGADHQQMLSLGKGDAVRKGFEAASGEVLMILDADLTVPPEELPAFYLALTEGRGEFISGTRLVYTMEVGAMRTLNRVANAMFGRLFSWLLNQRINDTLCGTKVLYKRDYERIARTRGDFGHFDPFGDFDLLFGAAKQNLKIAEVPVHYRSRTYGDVKIERFKHGFLLLKMTLIAIHEIKLR